MAELLTQLLIYFSGSCGTTPQMQFLVQKDRVWGGEEGVQPSPSLDNKVAWEMMAINMLLGGRC